MDTGLFFVNYLRWLYRRVSAKNVKCKLEVEGVERNTRTIYDTEPEPSVKAGCQSTRKADREAP